MLSQKSLFSYFTRKKVKSEDKYENVNASSKIIEYVKNMPYEIFFTNYLSLNKPCIILLKNIDNWKSKTEWISNGRPNFNFLKEKFGSSVVPVADCNVREYNSQKKKDMIFKDYIELCLNQENTNCELLYLKDWHFKREYPNYNAYETPEYFRSDWLNEFCEKLSDDYQFVYMGPKGTWTPLHADVFGSYSWSVNICGRKKWLLFPPGYENILKDERKELPYMVDENYLVEHDILHLKVIQESGEIIFVPSGWYHQVWNLEDTISINHNWFNGCNIEYVWKCLYQASIEVEKEIADIKDFEGWEDQWQIILKAHHGMNFSEFLQILQFIFRSRADVIESSEHIEWHHIFDIVSIRNVCSKIKDYSAPKNFLENIADLHQNIVSFLSDLVSTKNINISF